MSEPWEKTLAFYFCPKCRSKLEPYEVFASRLRGLKQPVCMNCAYEALAFLKDDVWPLLEELLAKLTESDV